MPLNGRSKSDGEGLYGVMVVLPSGQEVFLDVIRLGGEAATGRNLLAHLEPVIKKVGPERIASLITDGARNTALLRQLVSERYAKLLNTSCIVHSLNILCLKVYEIPIIADLFSSVKCIIERFIKSNTFQSRLEQVKDVLDLDAGALNKIASTCFYNCYLCLKALHGNKEAIVYLHKESGLNLPAALIEKIEDSLFWKEIEHLVTITEPLALFIKKAESLTFRLSDNFFDYIRLVFQRNRVMNQSHCSFGKSGQKEGE